MTGAELKTLRETLGLPVSWLADQAQVRQRSVNYWESGRFSVPEGIATMILDVETRLRRKYCELMVYVENGSPCLVRYRTHNEMLAYEPDLGSLPASAYAAMLGWIRLHTPIRIVWMESGVYRDWLGDRNECLATRLSWCASLLPEKEGAGK